MQLAAYEWFLREDLAGQNNYPRPSPEHNPYPYTLT